MVWTDQAVAEWAHGGLRRGEAVRLRWCDIDLVAGMVRITRQLQAPRGGLVEPAPKSAASRRMLTLEHATVGVLRRHQWHQQKGAEDHGRAWDARGYVFTAVRGGPLPPGRVSWRFLPHRPTPTRTPRP